MPKETGIIMSGSHPVDILEGRKTMTRRVIIPNLEATLCKNSDIVHYCNTRNKDTYMFEVWHPANKNTPLPLMIRCPYGGVGDRLKVKETWASENRFNHLKPSEIPQTAKIFYLADGGYSPFEMGKIRSSLFMPLRFSRITGEITEIRVERLQEISEEDAQKEGAEAIYKTAPNTFGAGFIWDAQGYRRGYELLWDSLNAKRGYSWEKNNWVWPIRFKLVDSR